MDYNRDMGMGPINGSAVGIILKELVRRGLTNTRRYLDAFEVVEKVGLNPNKKDFFTTADTSTQEVFVRSLGDCFPYTPVIAEESYKAKKDFNPPMYITVDPIDGTKAFMRRQSHGIGSMIALVDKGRVISAYIGEVSSQEIYGFRPGSEKRHRIREFNFCTPLTSPTAKLSESYVLLRDPERMYSRKSRSLIRKFENESVDGGSIGTWMARLWKQEVAAVLMTPFSWTPWDSAPIVGISQALDYVFLKPSKGSSWELFSPPISPQIVPGGHDVLVVHRSALDQLEVMGHKVS